MFLSDKVIELNNKLILSHAIRFDDVGCLSIFANDILCDIFDDIIIAASCSAIISSFIHSCCCYYYYSYSYYYYYYYY